VETPAQQEFLSDIGCNSLQGYLFARPLPPAEFLEVLTRREAAAERAVVFDEVGAAVS